MRETKFRAWDKQDKRMITHKQDFIPLLVTSAGVFRLSPFHKEPVYHLGPKDRFELMQYTGLKDKNGAEIYEGDIVQSKDYLPSIVEYDESRCCFMFHDLVVADGEYYKVHEEWEVIGNIYENPELLEA